MAKQSTSVTIVNHTAIDISTSANTLWLAILDEYVGAKKFLKAGYTIEPLDDPAAYLGGYRMQWKQHGVITDERTCFITELDEAGRRLSVCVTYLTRPAGMLVFSTYHAVEKPSGARYCIDCHSSLHIDQKSEASHKETAAVVAGMTKQFNEALDCYLESIKKGMEI